MNQSYVQLWGHPRIYALQTGWQSGVRSCIMPRMATHLVQVLNVGSLQRYSFLYTWLRWLCNISYFRWHLAVLVQIVNLMEETTAPVLQATLEVTAWIEYVSTKLRSDKSNIKCLVLMFKGWLMFRYQLPAPCTVHLIRWCNSSNVRPYAAGG